MGVTTRTNKAASPIICGTVQVKSVAQPKKRSRNMLETEKEATEEDNEEEDNDEDGVVVRVRVMVVVVVVAILSPEKLWSLLIFV